MDKALWITLQGFAFTHQVSFYQVNIGSSAQLASVKKVNLVHMILKSSNVYIIMKSIQKFKDQAIPDQQKIKGGKKEKEQSTSDANLKDWWHLYAWDK